MYKHIFDTEQLRDAIAALDCRTESALCRVRRELLENKSAFDFAVACAKVSSALRYEIFVYDVDCKQESFEKYNDVLSRIVDKTLMSDIAAKVNNSDEVMRDVLKKVADFELELVSSASDIISRLIDMIVNADADNTDYPRCLCVMQKFDTWLCSMNAIVSQENFKIKYITQRIKEKEDAKCRESSDND